jgi:hypothetical protein
MWSETTSGIQLSYRKKWVLVPNWCHTFLHHKFFFKYISKTIAVIPLVFSYCCKKANVLKMLVKKMPISQTSSCLSVSLKQNI